MVTTKQTETQKIKQESHTTQRTIGIIFAAIEAVLAFRLFFKLLGANPVNAFVHGLYAVSHFVTGRFEGIFAQVPANSTGSMWVFEPATLIAMVVVAFIGWVILKLLTPRREARVVIIEQTENTEPKK